MGFFFFLQGSRYLDTAESSHRTFGINIRGGSRTLHRGVLNIIIAREARENFETTPPFAKPRPQNGRDRDQRVADMNRTPEIDLHSLKQVHTDLENLLKNQQKRIALLEREHKRTKLEHKECMQQEKLKTVEAMKENDRMEKLFREERAKDQSEMDALKSQVKAFKRHIRQLELKECHITEMKAEFDGERAMLESELTKLKAVLVNTQQQLERETELRHLREKDIIISKQDLDTLRVRLVEGESDAYLREQELSKTVKMSKRLSQKLKQLKEHVATNMVSKSEMDLYKKCLDEKAKQQISEKLDVIDAQLKQQSETQEALAKLRGVTENEWKDKYDLVTQEMRCQVKQLKSEKERLKSEAKNYKKMYESELQRSKWSVK